MKDHVDYIPVGVIIHGKNDKGEPAEKYCSFSAKAKGYELSDVDDVSGAVYLGVTIKDV